MTGDVIPAEPRLLRRRFPQRALRRCGLSFLLTVPAGAAWLWRDPRTVDGEPVALKPTRFALSIGVYMLTASAMFRHVRPERRTALPARATVWMMMAGCGVEQSLIVLQAARARRSHFNRSTPADAVIYATMGAFAVLFVGAVLPLAWEIARHPDERADPLAVLATVAGLVSTFVVGGGTGALMGSNGRHGGGREGARLPVFGWSMTGGDLRPPHFLGIHAMQALPTIAAVAKALGPNRSRSLFAAGALAYGLLTAGLLHGALRGNPVVKTSRMDPGR